MIAIVNRRSPPPPSPNISGAKQFRTLRFCNVISHASERKQNHSGHLAWRQSRALGAVQRSRRWRRARHCRPVPADREDLPYKIEIWNESGAAVEQIVAVTANAGIGSAVHYAATREYPDHHITLRHKNSVVARWSGPQHRPCSTDRRSARGAARRDECLLFIQKRTLRSRRQRLLH